VLPEAPADLVDELSRRYIELYELITGEDFEFPDPSKEASDRIHDCLIANL
jgi:singapore isolate B (sub-type 7) whole genome shotgun sequence assembly, scaffold_11